MQIDIDIRKTLRSGKRMFNLDVRFCSGSKRIAIFGPSGSGKSLLLKAIAGLMRPDQGHIRINGAAVFDSGPGINLSAQARKMAYLFQDYALFPHLTVRQNIGFGLTHGWFFNPRARERDEKVDYWLDAFGLNPMANQYPDDLSGGQRQRTALARALVTQPQALLLDEPFAALDPALRVAMRTELDALQRRLEVPMLIITHDPDDVHVFGDHVLQLHEGSIPDAEHPCAGREKDRSP